MEIGFYRSLLAGLLLACVAVAAGCEDEGSAIPGPDGGSTGSTTGMDASTTAQTTGGPATTTGVTSTTSGSDAAVDAATDAAGDAGATSGEAVLAIAAGDFAPLPDYAGSSAGGFAVLARHSDGTSQLSVQASGLSADTMYPAHLHGLPCDVDQGGGHYKIDPSVMDTQEANEIWPSFTTDAEGDGVGVVDTSHSVRPDGMSVVIHDPDNMGAKMLCADLKMDDALPTVATGELAPFAMQDPDLDGNITGSATLTRDATSTLELTVRGLDPAQSYSAHVHALPCDVMDAGGHYKVDPTETGIDPADPAMVEANEIWPAVMPDANGEASDSIDLTQMPRPDAQSLVIHRAVSEDDKPKVACADLRRSDYDALVTSGSVQELPAAATHGVAGLTGEGSLTRSLDGTTTAAITVSGLAADTEYGVHVHDQACAHGDGGGHYKLDTSVTETLEENEIWLTFTTDAGGEGAREVTVAHLARAEAQSIVVHAPGGDRVGCIDLDN